jgi:hypothetical protein
MILRWAGLLGAGGGGDPYLGNTKESRNFAFSRVHKVAMRRHGGSTPNRPALYGGNQRFLEIDQGVDQSRLRTFPCCWRVRHEVLGIVARTKRIARGIPKRNTHLIVSHCVFEELRHRDIHARSHCVLLGWTIRTPQFLFVGFSGNLQFILVCYPSHPGARREPANSPAAFAAEVPWHRTLVRLPC